MTCSHCGNDHNTPFTCEGTLCELCFEKAVEERKRETGRWGIYYQCGKHWASSMPNCPACSAAKDVCEDLPSQTRWYCGCGKPCPVCEQQKEPAPLQQELIRPTNPKQDAERPIGNWEDSSIRHFSTGATRDTDEVKHDPEGFNSPLVELAFCEYMTKHRIQADGAVRASDNWQKGMPRDAYMKSLWRHFLSLWLHHREWGQKAQEPLVEALCALRFNVDGYLFEVLKERNVK